MEWIELNLTSYKKPKNKTMWSNVLVCSGESDDVLKFYLKLFVLCMIETLWEKSNLCCFYRKCIRF